MKEYRDYLKHFLSTEYIVLKKEVHNMYSLISEFVQHNTKHAVVSSSAAKYLVQSNYLSFIIPLEQNGADNSPPVFDGHTILTR